jgi:hypothetical protein
MNRRKLVFVYNAQSGILNAVKDSLHKTFAPKTYQCNLCAVTFGSVTMKREWKRFVENLDITVEFLHIDEFESRYSGGEAARFGPYPAVFIVKEELHSGAAGPAASPAALISAEEINSITSLSELMDLVTKKLNAEQK